jgi:hypothetical protein
MRYQFLILTLIFSINQKSLAQSKVALSSGHSGVVSAELKPFFSPSEGQLEDLLKGEVISIGKVESPTKKEQQMMLFVSGIHPRNCTRAMRKLSLYENYQNYMDFIKKSSYDDKTQKFSFIIDHGLIPFSMVVGFKIPRIAGPGVYPFTFEDGFLKGLEGRIIVREVGKYCLMGLKTDWRGPDSGIPDLIFGTFVQTVGKLGLEHLIRVSIF